MPDGRQHIESALRGATLQRRDDPLGAGDDRPLLPHETLVYVGGCVFDAGAEALLDVASTLLKLDSALVAVGGGERAKHCAMIAAGIGVPTGGIAQIIASCEEMNAEVLAALLQGRGVPLAREHIWDIGALLELGMLPIMLSVPPYSLWETPSGGGLPEHGSDFGVERLAAVFGIKIVTAYHAANCQGCG
jgi:hypothetical protein